MAVLKEFPVNDSFESILRRLDGLEGHHDGGGDMVDERVAKLETIADFMRADLSDIKKEMRESRLEFKKEMSESRNEFRAEMREFRAEMKNDNKTTRTTVVITGISVVLGIGGIVGGMLYSIAQIQTAWLTSVVQILNK